MEAKNNLINSGWLKVGAGHSLYYEDWGNPKAKVPIIYLHGGPGGYIKETDKLQFNPLIQRIVFFDQRGGGKSKPLGSVDSNTTNDMLADIDKLRKHLKIGVVSLTGGSWGSSLALLYAIENPEIVQKLLLWSVFLIRNEDKDYMYQGKGVFYNFPEVWNRYLGMVPAMEQHDTVGYYSKQFEHRDKAVRERYVSEWLLFESSLLSLDDQADRKIIEQEASDEDSLLLAYSKIEAHYITNKHFVDNNYILDNAKAIKHIPTILVHGRYDFACPLKGALELSDTLGNNSYLHIVPSNHSRGSAVLREVIKAYSRSFLL